MSNLINLNMQIQTFYKFVSVNPKTGKETILSDWSPNVLLVTGRNEIGKREWWTGVQVGRDNTEPADGQTTLQDYVAGTETVVQSSYGASASPPYYGWKRRVYRFYTSSGIGNENLQEVGLCWDKDVQSSIITRALIVDINGDRVAVTPLPDEWMDVHCEVRYYPPLNDVTGQIVVPDLGTYNYILRASSVTSGDAWGKWIGKRPAIYSSYYGDWYVTDDDIGSITQGPSGIATNLSTLATEYNANYAENSYQRTFGVLASTGSFNSETGKLLRSMRIATTMGYYQIQFDDVSNPGFGIPKTSLYTFRVGYTVGWGPVA